MPTNRMELIIQERNPEDIARKLRWIGIAFLVMGGLAVLLPAVTGLALGITLGVILLLGGVAQLLYGIQSRIHKRAKLLAGGIYLVIGILLLAYPAAGLVSLALVIGFLFFGQGVLEILYGLRLRPLKGWGWATFGGAVSLVLALLIWAGLPEGAAWLIGLLFGLGLIVNGLSALGLAAAVRE